jgi:hypothetical protein
MNLKDGRLATVLLIAFAAGLIIGAMALGSRTGPAANRIQITVVETNGTLCVESVLNNTEHFRSNFTFNLSDKP